MMSLKDSSISKPSKDKGKGKVSMSKPSEDMKSSNSMEIESL